MAGMKRLTIDVGSEFDNLLEALSEAKGTTKADIIRKAVATYAYLDKHTGNQTDRKVSITDDSDKVVKDIIVP